MFGHVQLTQYSPVGAAVPFGGRFQPLKLQLQLLQAGERRRSRLGQTPGAVVLSGHGATQRLGVQAFQARELLGVEDVVGGGGRGPGGAALVVRAAAGAAAEAAAARGRTHGPAATTVVVVVGVLLGVRCAGVP